MRARLLMDRRAFFSSALRKTTQEVVKRVDAKVVSDASRWIRPPFAIAELEFILSCTRCRDCIDACPHQVLFALPSRLGVRVAATPAIDLLNRGCHLCDGWPCVNACEAGTLVFPVVDDENETVEIPLPTLAQATIDSGACFAYSGPECGACESSCPVPGALLWDQQRPFIDAEKCVGCALCREACIVDPKAILITSSVETGASGTLG